MVKIIADSVCDLAFDVLEEYNIDIVPLKVTMMDGITYDDRIELSIEEFYRQLKSSDGVPKTAASGPIAYKKAFQKAFDEGADSIICFTMSSNASAAFQNASLAAQELDGKIDIVDTRTASCGTGLNVYEGARLAKAGVDHDEIYRLSVDRVQRLRTLVLLDTMEYLAKGGRISGTAAAMGSILRIKPIIQFMRNGKIGLLHRARGMKRGMDWLVDYCCSLRKDFSDTLLYVAYAEQKDIAYRFLDMMRERTRVGEVLLSGIGSVVGTHIGTTGVGVFFEEDPKLTKNDF